MLLSRVPTLLERHETYVAQRRVQSLVVVERQPIHHLIHRLGSGGKFSAVQSADFESAPQDEARPG